MPFRRGLRVIAIAGLVAATGVLLSVPQIGFGLEEERGLSWLFMLRGSRAAPPEAVVVRFDDASDGLVAYGAEGPIGFELCGDAPGSCRYAQASIRSDRVTLQAPGAPAATPRYQLPSSRARVAFIES